MNILFVVPYTPSRIRTRPFHFIKALTANGHRVTLAALWTSLDDRRALEQLASEVHAVIPAPLSKMRSIWNCVCAVPTGEPLQARFSWSPELSGLLAGALRRHQYDVVHVEHLRGVRYGLSATEAGATLSGRRVPVVWDSVDCISDLFRHAALQGRTARVRWAAKLELPRTERYEGAVAPRFARVVVTSEADRQGLLRLVARTADTAAVAAVSERVTVVPNGVDLDYFAPAADEREPSTIVMSGKMSYHANVAAVVKFAEEVMPRVQSRRPETRLLVVGKDPSPEVRRLADNPRVVVTGTVDDIRPYLRRATLAVAPIQYGVGIQNKVLEALACATPVVATSAAVNALGAGAGHEVAVADGPDETARALLDLLNGPDERTRMGLAGRRYVEQHHNWRTIADQLAGIYDDARA